MVSINATAYGKKSNLPCVTSQVDICTIPFHFDPYVGCPHGCLYCFARDLVNFRRRNSPLTFGQLEINSYAHFHKAINRILSRPIDEKNILSVFLKNRVPLKIGAVADPCPESERKNRLTYAYLRLLQDLDYPVQIQTKRPDVLSEYIGDFKGANLIVSVTIIASDRHSEVIEPNVLNSSGRFAAIRKITDLGFPVLIRCQPAIYPIILEDLPWLIDQTKESGAWGFQTEGLKLRIAAPQSEKDHFRELGRALGIPDIYAYYRENGSRSSSDYELSVEQKMEYTAKARDLTHKAGLVYLSADNQEECILCSDSDECCGTQKLRNYKKFTYNLRTKIFTGKDWPELENGLERAIYTGRNCEEGMVLKDFVRAKVEKGEKRK
jgi:DNA repair photolyase